MRWLRSDFRQQLRLQDKALGHRSGWLGGQWFTGLAVGVGYDDLAADDPNRAESNPVPQHYCVGSLRLTVYINGGGNVVEISAASRILHKHNCGIGLPVAVQVAACWPTDDFRYGPRGRAWLDRLRRCLATNQGDSLAIDSEGRIQRTEVPSSLRRIAYENDAERKCRDDRIEPSHAHTLQEA